MIGWRWFVVHHRPRGWHPCDHDRRELVFARDVWHARETFVRAAPASWGLTSAFSPALWSWELEPEKLRALVAAGRKAAARRE